MNLQRSSHPEQAQLGQMAQDIVLNISKDDPIILHLCPMDHATRNCVYATCTLKLSTFSLFLNYFLKPGSKILH